MDQIFSNTTLTVNQLIEKIDTGELGLPELQRPFIWKDSKVRDLFDSLMRGYPIGYLMKAQGYTDAKINQMANYAFIDWKDNMDILDDAPSVYYPIVCEGRSDEEILRMEEENALPHGWENMPYEDFLVERRKLMAAKIKQAFDLLKKNVE